MANYTVLLSAVGATGASAARAGGSQSSVSVHVYSASTSTASVTIQQSVDNVAWYTVATVTNPTSAGELWAGPAANYTRVNVATWSAGAITAVCSTRLLSSDPLGQEWRKVDQAAEAFGALSVSALTNSGLTATRVPFSGSGGLQADAAAFTYASGLLSSTIFGGASKDTTAAKLTDGAIASAPGTLAITKGSALGSSTLATPTTTTHDGYILRIVSTTAYAHVVSVASGKVNGGTLTTITFTSAAIGDSVTLLAYQGVWYTIGTTGTITIT